MVLPVWQPYYDYYNKITTNKSSGILQGYASLQFVFVDTTAGEYRIGDVTMAIPAAGNLLSCCDTTECYCVYTII